MIQSQKFGPYGIINNLTLVNYKLESFVCSGTQKTRHRSNIVQFYPKELFVQEQIRKCFSDNSLLRLHPKKPIIS